MFTIAKCNSLTEYAGADTTSDITAVRKFRKAIAARFHRCDSGASAVEFAIVAPVFIVLLLGALAYGMYLGTSHSVAQLTADAARASVAGLNDAERASIARDHVARNASGFPLVDPDRLQVQAGPSPTDGSQFQVVLRYDASHMPIWYMSSFLPMPEKTLQRTSVIKRGGL